MSGSSSSPLRDILPALSELPIFPLPQVALFPGTMMPLHIFEPRYRTMIRAIIDSHKTIGVVQIIDSESKDAAGHPKIASVAGVGVLVDYAELPSGRFNVVVRGRARVEIEELPFVAPYRRAKASVIASTHENALPGDIAALISSATSFASIVHERDSGFALRLLRDADAGTLADHCASQLLIDGRDRQRVLETRNVIERVRLVTEIIALQRLALAGDGGALN